MSGPAKTTVPVDLVDVLRELADSKAYRYAHHQLELPDAADDLQHFADRIGLVALLGQDAVQAEISGPFAWVRGHLNDNKPQDDGEPDQDLPSDYAARLVRDWELDDPRDRWRWTGELPPVQQVAAIEKAPYRTPQSTIDAFHFVLSAGDLERLAAWLLHHPDDAPALFKSVEVA
ncbi:hypothetical protein [Bradyrhizobium diazoefficiens]|uniref:hypothetical protein n=1 Tax=Bradyrhizobium diazoefficiens TaxID=1355477 RepID=UPI0027154985|nr:hypothetical protein [Bradyrhizobium diazoefficiens]WLA53200.1 hypothetical protein QIH81_21675 [Bradyrhizobium diazoefficiens]